MTSDVFNLTSSDFLVVRDVITTYVNLARSCCLVRIPVVVMTRRCALNDNSRSGEAQLGATFHKITPSGSVAPFCHRLPLVSRKLSALRNFFVSSDGLRVTNVALSQISKKLLWSVD